MTSVQKDQQLERSGFLENMCYSMIKNFFDQADIEINGTRRGLYNFILKLLRFKKFQFLFFLNLISKR